MSGYLLAAIIMRNIDAAESFHFLGDHHCGNLQALISRQALFRRDRNRDHTVYFPLAQLGENIFFFLQAAVRIADDNAESFIKCLIFYRFYDLTEKRIGDFRNQQADDVCPVSGQALGDEVWLIVKLFDPMKQNKRMNGNFLITIPLFGEFVNGI